MTIVACCQKGLLPIKLATQKKRKKRKLPESSKYKPLEITQAEFLFFQTACPSWHQTKPTVTEQWMSEWGEFNVPLDY